MDLQKIIQGLINSESRCEDDYGYNKSLTVVKTEWIDQLKKYLNESKEGEEKREGEEDLRKKRQEEADKAYNEYDFDGLEICDAGGWYIEDSDSWVKQVYFVDDTKKEPSTESIRFIVTFKKNTSKVIDICIL